MSDENDNARQILEIEAELRRGVKAERAAKLADDLVEAAYSGGRVDPADIERFVWSWMDEHPLRYQCLLDVCDGNEKRIVEYVRDHMLKLAQHGIERTIQAAFDDMERLAATFMMKGTRVRLL